MNNSCNTQTVSLSIHSFIADTYIAPLQVGLLRSAPIPSAAKCLNANIAQDVISAFMRLVQGSKTIDNYTFMQRPA